MGLTTSRSLARLSLLVAVLGLAWSAPALAAPPAAADADAEQLAQAMQLYDEGTKAARINQWDKARTFYLHAWNVHKHWQIAANLGLAEAKAGKHRAAAEHLSYFLREAPNVTPGDRKKTQDLIDKAKAKVGTLTIAVSVEGAEIRIDGTAVGTSPIKEDLFVEPGAHVVEARREGYQPAQVSQEMQTGGTASVELQMVKEEAKVEAPPPPVVVKVKESGADKAVIVTGAVTGGIVAGVGAGFTVAAWRKWKERNGPVSPSCQPTPQACKAAAESERWGFAVAAITSYIVAGVVGAETLTYALVKRQDKPQSAARVDLLLGSDTAGAMITVSW